MPVVARYAAFPLASAAFLLSGFAALTYQIVWQRLLVLPIGADVYSTTIIVAAFMAGLGIGSLVGGHVADRLSPAACIVLFIGAELSVAAFGFVSRRVFYDWMYLGLGNVAMPPIAMAAIVFVSLLWPTFWMGMSLPVLSRAITQRIAGAARQVGLLYGLNTLGAAAGAFVTTWILFPRIGFDASLQIAVVVNVLAAVTVLPILVLPRHSAVADVSDRQTNRVEPRGSAAGWPLHVWIGLYALSGFQALSLEILWFRLLSVTMKASAFTFGTLLTIFLSGLGAGAALGSLLLRNVRRPGQAFLLLQAFVGLYAAGSILVLVAFLPSSKDASSLWTYLSGYEPLNAAAAFSMFWSGTGDAATRAEFIRLYVWLPFLIVGPPTLAMGASFPLLQKIALVESTRVGSRVALVLLANIAGSTLGSFLTGWLALTYLTSSGSLKVMAAMGAFFLAAAAFAGRSSQGRSMRIAHVALLVLFAIAMVQLPDGRKLWATLHGADPQRVVQAEDATGLSLLKATANGAMVFVNGIGQSWIPYGNVHTVLGALPAFIHPNPKDAAIIGLGSGDTVYALAGRSELERITCVEIIRPQLETLREWEKRTRNPGLAALLSDPRIEHVSGDGRTYVMRSARRFDIIEADALRPASAYSGNLYSVGYFTLLRSRLAPGGIAVTWVPTRRVEDTFGSVFPHVLSFGDIALGSEQPIEFDPTEIKRRVQSPPVQAYYMRAGVIIESLLAPYLVAGRPRQINTQPRARRTDLNEDLFPRDEFSVPRVERRNNERSSATSAKSQ